MNLIHTLKYYTTPTKKIHSLNARRGEKKCKFEYCTDENMSAEFVGKLNVPFYIFVEFGNKISFEKAGKENKMRKKGSSYPCTEKSCFQ
jgi:hypothetical protein